MEVSYVFIVDFLRSHDIPVNFRLPRSHAHRYSASTCLRPIRSGQDLLGRGYSPPPPPPPITAVVRDTHRGTGKARPEQRQWEDEEGTSSCTHVVPIQKYSIFNHLILQLRVLWAFRIPNDGRALCSVYVNGFFFTIRFCFLLLLPSTSHFRLTELYRFSIHKSIYTRLCLFLWYSSSRWLFLGSESLRAGGRKVCRPPAGKPHIELKTLPKFRSISPFTGCL